MQSFLYASNDMESSMMGQSFVDPSSIGPSTAAEDLTPAQEQASDDVYAQLQDTIADLLLGMRLR